MERMKPLNEIFAWAHPVKDSDVNIEIIVSSNQCEIVASHDTDF